MIKTVPTYLWFCGGIFSASGVFLFYWLIPKMGAGAMISFAMSGQITLAIVASHYGWFNLPVTPITIKKLMGCVSLVLGVFLINNR